MDVFKPNITKMYWFEGFIGMDWEHRRFAFNIVKEHGQAGILHQPQGPGTGGVDAAISAHKITGFMIRPHQDTTLYEIILQVTYPPYDKSLGLTEDLATATRWVADANMIVRTAREKRERAANG